MSDLLRRVTRFAPWKVALALSVCLMTPHAVFGTVFFAKDEALHIAFPQGIEVSEKTVVLSSEQREEIERISQAKVSSGLFHFFEGRQNGEVTGYAVIDSRVMRTNLAVYMVVLSKTFAVEKVVLLAFNEPLEYQPTDGWLKYLEGNQPIDEIAPGQGVPPIAGSTLSVHGLSDGVRVVRASFEVVLKGTR
jgi:hypothetical protein